MLTVSNLATANKRVRLILANGSEVELSSSGAITVNDDGVSLCLAKVLPPALRVRHFYFNPRTAVPTLNFWTNAPEFTIQYGGTIGEVTYIAADYPSEDGKFEIPIPTGEWDKIINCTVPDGGNGLFDTVSQVQSFTDANGLGWSAA